MSMIFGTKSQIEQLRLVCLKLVVHAASLLAVWRSDAYASVLSQ